MQSLGNGEGIDLGTPNKCAAPDSAGLRKAGERNRHASSTHWNLPAADQRRTPLELCALCTRSSCKGNGGLNHA